MTDWFFIHGTVGNPNYYAGHDGTTPEKGWVMSPAYYGQYEGAINPAAMSPGDTMWILDTHTWPNWGDLITNGAFPGITIRGDYPGRPGVMRHVSLKAGSHGASIRNLTINNPASIALVIDGSHDIELSNLKVSAYKQCIRFGRDNSSNNVHIHHCEIFGGVEGIECFALPIATRDGWIVEYNHVHNIGDNYLVLGGQDNEGMGFQRITNTIIRHNHIHDCHYGINIWESGSASVNNVEITDNWIHDITRGPASWPSRGIMFSGGYHGDGALYNVAIEDNKIFNVGREGIRVQEPDSGGVGLFIGGNLIGGVNTEFGTPNTEYIAGDLGSWVIMNERLSGEFTWQS